MSSTPRREVATDVWRRLRALGATPEIAAAEHRTMHDSGLTGGPIRALRALPLDEPLSMRELAVRMGCDSSYVTSLVDALESRSLADRRPHPTDRRVKVIALTASGRDLAARVQREYAEPPALLDSLSRTELETLRSLLAKLDA